MVEEVKFNAVVDSSGDRCGTCLYWVRDREPIEGMWNGDCRKRSPRPFLVATPNAMTRQAEIGNITMFPRTVEDKWCGEYRSRKAGGKK